MAAHRKLVDTDYAERPRLEPTPATESQQTERIRKLTFKEVAVAIVAGVIAAWITD